jgi:thiol-disulfide isomerase/thioredoxin
MVAALAIGAIACRKSIPVPDGDVAATLTVPTTADKPFEPATLRGKPALVVFAWPTCPHCMKELPIAQKVADSENANLVVVFVQGAKKNAMSVASQLNLTAPVLVDNGTLRERYAVRAVPYTLVLGPDGRARDAFLGAQDESTLRDAVADAR